MTRIRRQVELRSADGQTMAEYGVVLTVITTGIVAAIALLSGDIHGTIDAIRAIAPG